MVPHHLFVAQAEEPGSVVIENASLLFRREGLSMWDTAYTTECPVFAASSIELSYRKRGGILNFMNAIRCIGLIFVLAVSPTRIALPGIAQQTADDRLVLSVAAIPPRSSNENWAFNVNFRNSRQDVNLRLGFVLQDGKEYPVNIFLILSNAKGISKELRVRPPAIPPGNMGNDVIILSAGGEHSIKLGLERLDGWQAFSGNSTRTGSLLPGDYRLHAEFRWWEYEITKTATKNETSYREKMNLKSDEISFTVK